MQRLLLASTLLVAINSFAHAADAPQEVVVVPDVFTWSGVYVGGNVGYAWGDTDADSNVPASDADGFFPDQDYDYDGATAGVQIGYNYQINQFVIGAEADINWVDLEGESDEVGGIGDPYRTKIDWFATVRARAGYAWDRTLIYVTGGLAYGDVKDEYVGAAGTTSSRSTEAGWTIGGGAEYAFTDNWTVKGEYLYVDLDDQSLGNPIVGDVTFDHDFSLVRLGVNYKF